LNVELYAKGAVNESNVGKWCQLFKVGRTNVHDEERSRSLSLATNNKKIKKTVNAKILGNRQFTFTKLQENFSRPESEKWPREKRRSAGLYKRFGGKIISKKAYKRCSQDMTNVLIYMANMCSSSLM
jgi:hypothetical protein